MYVCVLFMIFSKTIRAGYSGLRGPFIAGIGHQYTYTDTTYKHSKYNFVEKEEFYGKVFTSKVMLSPFYVPHFVIMKAFIKVSPRWKNLVINYIGTCVTNNQSKFSIELEIGQWTQLTMHQKLQPKSWIRLILNHEWLNHLYSKLFICISLNMKQSY